MTTEIEIIKTEEKPVPEVENTPPETVAAKENETPPLSDEMPKKRKRKYTRHKREAVPAEVATGHTVDPESQIEVEGAELNRESSDNVVPSFTDENETTDQIADEAEPSSSGEKDYTIYVVLFGIGMIALIYYLYTRYGKKTVVVSPEMNVEQPYNIVFGE